MSDIKAVEQKAELAPVIGVTIECRIVVKNSHDWDYIRETLDNCRCYGAAEVVNTVVFQS